jgi:transcriptional regulator with XRE-family HTH domain
VSRRKADVEGLTPAPSARRHRSPGVADRLRRFEEAVFARIPGSRQHAIDAQTRALLVHTLAIIRKQRGLTQGEIALRMNTTQSAVSDLEKGIKDPRLSTLQRYARALDLELQVLLSGHFWTIVYSWDDRTIDYLSVKPVRIEEGIEDLWMAVFKQRMGEQKIEIGNMQPIEPLEVIDDRYLSDKEIIEWSASRDVRIKEVASRSVDA